MNVPDEISLKVLSIIKKSKGKITKKHLIEKLQEIKIIPNFEEGQRSAPHSRLRPILDPLISDWKFVEIKSRGSKSEVVLTDQGETAFKIFGDF